MSDLDLNAILNYNPNLLLVENLLKSVLDKVSVSELIHAIKDRYPDLYENLAANSTLWKNKFLSELPNFPLTNEQQSIIRNWLQYYGQIDFLITIPDPDEVMNIVNQDPERFRNIPFFWEWFAFNRLLTRYSKEQGPLNQEEIDNIKQNLNVINYFEFCQQIVTSSMNYIGNIKSAHGIEIVDEILHEDESGDILSARYANYNSNISPILNYNRGFKKVKSSDNFTLAIDYFNQVHVSGKFLQHEDIHWETIIDANGFIHLPILAKDIDSNGAFFCILDTENVIWLFGNDILINRYKQMYEENYLQNVLDYDSFFDIN